MGILAGKHVVLGVSGSIASYKVIELARQLTVAGALVDVILTEEAARFITPLTFQSLTYRPVYTEMWSTLENAAAHIKLGHDADVVVIAPATAHTIASIAAGFANNLILTTVLATGAPVLLAPAMETHMWHNPATADNVALLRRRGLHVMEPDEGMLASGLVGSGRLPEITRIEVEIRKLLSRRFGRMAGRNVVVTAGGTHEPLDPVRFIGNRASGQMGFALAEAARDEGAQVVLIAGQTTAPLPQGVDVVHVETAGQMHDAVHAAIDDADLLIMNAAVADYRPAQMADHKMKKTEADLTIALERTADILQSLVANTQPIKVGFAAETNDLLTYAADKMRRKGLDAIVANDAVSSIGQSEIEVTLLTSDGGSERLPRQPKPAAAQQILERVLHKWPDRLGPKTS
ncbi:MAG TPA: bifunctional phosphopantothenoylcysteine decarboxylase/phosphopantothenate--cysteine ligase CoaBC [Herpetosiphonaceae bacterium]